MVATSDKWGVLQGPLSRHTTTANENRRSLPTWKGASKEWKAMRSALASTGGPHGDKKRDDNRLRCETDESALSGRRAVEFNDIGARGENTALVEVNFR